MKEKIEKGDEVFIKKEACYRHGIEPGKLYVIHEVLDGKLFYQYRLIVIKDNETVMSDFDASELLLQRKMSLT